MDFKTYFSMQARKPDGLFGRFYMSRLFEKGNAELNALVYEALDIQGSGHLLELGFGTGALMNRIARKLDSGLVEGVDFSKTMVSLALKKNRKFLRQGKVKIHLGDFDEMGFADGRFDRVFTVNTIYFWTKPEATLCTIWRLLKPGGRLVVGFHDKRDMEKMPLNTDVFRYYSSRDMSELFSTRFAPENIRVVSRRGKRIDGFCAVGFK